jgi:hypothetical protein
MAHPEPDPLNIFVLSLLLLQRPIGSNLVGGTRIDINY